MSKKAQKPAPKQEQNNEYDNTNSGALFINEKKQKPNHPDFQGSLTDKDGNEYWVSGWKHVSKGGKKYISLALTEKDETTETDKGSSSSKDAW